MISFKSFIRQLCEAVNFISNNLQAELNIVLTGTFTKETENKSLKNAPLGQFCFHLLTDNDFHAK